MFLHQNIKLENFNREKNERIEKIFNTFVDANYQIRQLKEKNA